MFEDLKKWDNASVKDYVHVRVNVSGSPLECPGWFIFFFPSFFVVLTFFFLILFTSSHFFPLILGCLETFPSVGRVRVKHRGILLTLKGTVIRSGSIKMIEGEKIYECRTCKHRYISYFIVLSDSVTLSNSILLGNF